MSCRTGFDPTSNTQGAGTRRVCPLRHGLGFVFALVAFSVFGFSASAIADQLYGFGENFSGQLGSAADSGPNPAPKLVTLPGRLGTITAIAEGDSFSLAATSDGQLYAFGQTSGLGSPFSSEERFTPHPTPTLVTLPEATGGVAQIAAGDESSFAITSSGQMYAWGSNGNGQLSVGRQPQGLQTPMLITLPEATGVPVELAAGNEFVLVRTSSGQLYELWLQNQTNTYPRTKSRS